MRKPSSKSPFRPAIRRGWPARFADGPGPALRPSERPANGLSPIAGSPRPSAGLCPSPGRLAQIGAGGASICLAGSGTGSPSGQPHCAILHRPQVAGAGGKRWAVVLSSPLLAMFENGQKAFRLVAQEFLSSLPINPGTCSASKRYHRSPRAPPSSKPCRWMLPACSMCCRQPADSAVVSSGRYSMRMTQGLKISAQFELNADQPEQRLVLPQPSPKSWSAFTSANRYLPRTTWAPMLRHLIG